MSKKRIISGVAAVVALVIAIILLGANRGASATEREFCVPTYFKIAVDTPRATFFEIYGNRGERIAYSTRGHIIKVQTEKREWMDCGVRRVYTFTKIGDNAWTLSR